jgi:hypothetical protein
MVAVVLSGVAGRFIYIQIPRTIEGRALSLNEIVNMKTDLTNVLHEKFKLDTNTIQLFISFSKDEEHPNKKPSVRNLRKVLRQNKLPKTERISIINMVKNEKSLSQKIARLEKMQKLFKYWHVAHLPFALIMLVIVIIHVAVTLLFGYKWIF